MTLRQPGLKLARYLTSTRRLLENAVFLLDRGEPEKAGECLWGAMVTGTKAVAAYRQAQLRNHREVVYYVRNLARELDRETLYRTFQIANGFHSNFYESHLTADDVQDAMQVITAEVAFLVNLIPEEVRRSLESDPPASDDELFDDIDQD